jgi:hypothetical protein
MLNLIKQEKLDVPFNYLAMIKGNWKTNNTIIVWIYVVGLAIP